MCVYGGGGRRGNDCDAMSAEGRGQTTYWSWTDTTELLILHQMGRGSIPIDPQAVEHSDHAEDLHGVEDRLPATLIFRLDLRWIR